MKRSARRGTLEVIVILTAVMGLLIFAHCGDDDDGDDGSNHQGTETQICQVSCEKFDECLDYPLYPWPSVSACVADCLEDDASGDDMGEDDGFTDPSDCEPPPSDAEIQVCLNAFAAASCDDVLNDRVSECTQLCPTDTGDSDEPDMAPDLPDVAPDGDPDITPDLEPDLTPDLSGDCTSGSGTLEGSYQVLFTGTTTDTCRLDELFGLPSSAVFSITDQGAGAITGSLLILEGAPQSELSGTVSGNTWTLSTTVPEDIEGPLARCDYTLTATVTGTYGDSQLCGTVSGTVAISGATCTIDGTSCSLVRTFEAAKE